MHNATDNDEYDGAGREAASFSASGNDAWSILPSVRDILAHPWITNGEAELARDGLAALTDGPEAIDAVAEVYGTSREAVLLAVLRYSHQVPSLAAPPCTVVA